MKYFGRRCRITVGTLQSEDVHFKFTIKRSLQQTLGTCEVEIYNLSKEHRDEIRDASHPLVRVEAGYKDGMSVLFEGNERQTSSVRDGATWTTKIKAGDGQNALRLSRCSRSFGAQTQVRDVLRYLVDQLGVGAGNADDALNSAALDQLDAVFPHGTTVRGPVARELTELLRSANLEWSVQQGVLQILQRGAALNRDAIKLSPETGMVGSPEIGKHKLVKVKALLAPDLVPGRKVTIESDAVNGTYRIEAAEYSGEVSAQDWYANLDVREIT